MLGSTYLPSKPQLDNPDADTSGALWLSGKGVKDLADDVFRLFMHLCICCILNRMGDKYALRVGHSQRICLRRSGADKLRRSNRNRGRSLNFKPYRVMQTARSTGSSVSQSLNHKVIIALNFFA
jgi:hypothetical protein